MNVVHAISKVRFASARPQRVQLGANDAWTVEMLCMESGQRTEVASGLRTYYVVMGSAKLAAGAESTDLSAGQVACLEADERHSIANAGEGRLVCLAVAAAH